MKYTVIYEKSETGWGAYAPDLPGLGVVGSTFEEAQQLIKEGIEFHIQTLKDYGEPVPAPTTQSEQVEVAA